MPRFSANLSFLFADLPFEKRFAAAAAAGFGGVEYVGAYDMPMASVKSLLSDNGLEQVLFNMPTGDWEKGERGLACRPGREDAFRDSVVRALDYAAATGCRMVHCMAGLMGKGEDAGELARLYCDNLLYAADLAEQAGVKILIEPINPIDMPGYLLNSVEQAAVILDQLDHPNLALQFDIYHAQIVGGNIAARLDKHLDKTAHIQIAGVPGRHEPDSGELNYPFLFYMLDRVGYDGWIGCEYRPHGNTDAGLDWIRPWMPKS
ncbi:2-oxo-tetronate isomerase [Thalassospira xiamenensis]|uniref:Hydroxypyruvate isomerase n=1 Tax=Thalassospira xiamenensis TaxID=220697 RepID=A0A285RIW0_9PROT|nr:2-oxo-tetronate isomerase [Thalassospira xiamenensis]SOB94040.1 hydroxypyruvate isomerase [Thalassospira xiamenensis]